MKNDSDSITLYLKCLSKLNQKKLNDTSLWKSFIYDLINIYNHTVNPNLESALFNLLDKLNFKTLKFIFNNYETKSFISYLNDNDDDILKYKILDLMYYKSDKNGFLEFITIRENIINHDDNDDELSLIDMCFKYSNYDVLNYIMELVNKNKNK